MFALPRPRWLFSQHWFFYGHFFRAFRSLIIRRRRALKRFAIAML